MANATATITIFPYPRGFDNTQRFQIVRGTIAISAGTYPVGGIPLSWGALTNTNGAVIESIPLPSALGTNTSIFPVDVDIHSTGYVSSSAGTGPSGFIYLWDSVQGNLHIFESSNGASAASGPLIEIGAANLPGTVVNDTIQFTAFFARNN